MILRGGANIYPAEVEAAVSAHPKVRSRPPANAGARSVSRCVQASEYDLGSIHLKGPPAVRAFRVASGIGRAAS
jgi:acyl-CoA synthetase (AMP-forming)/AMP-acid ligase II